MKAFSFLIIGLLNLYSLNVNSQEKHRSPVAYILVKEFGGKQNFDTLVTFDTIGNKVDRWVQTFDKQGNTLTQTKEKWNNNKWITENQITSTFDKAGNQLTCFLASNKKSITYDAQYFYKYDSKGNELSESAKMCYGGKCEDGSMRIFTYDSRGNKLTKIEKEWKDNQWIITNECFYSYDKKGNMLSETYKSYHNKLLMTGGRYTYQYNQKGKLINKIGETLIDGLWVLNHRLIYTFDEFDNELSMTHQRYDNGNWINLQREVCTYDSKSNKLSKTEEDWKNGSWKTKLISEWEYDSLKRVITQEISSPEIGIPLVISRLTYQYNNDEGNLTEQRYYTRQNGRLVFVELINQDYNKRGMLIRREIQSFGEGNHGKTIRYEYTYDENNSSVVGKVDKIVGETYTPTQIVNDSGLGFYFDNKNKMPTYHCHRFKASLVSVK